MIGVKMIKLKKIIKETANNILPYLYHATYRQLVNEIMKDGIIPGGKNIRNYDWAEKNYVYLSESDENAISFVETSENENVPESWLDDIVVLKIDANKLDLTKLEKDTNWNPDISDSDTDWQSYQYKGVVPPNLILSID